MLKVSALLSLLENHLKVFAAINQPVPVEIISTVTSLLSSCKAHAIDMEAQLYPPLPKDEPTPANTDVAMAVPTTAEIIHVNFAAPATPAGPAS